MVHFNLIAFIGVLSIGCASELRGSQWTGTTAANANVTQLQPVVERVFSRKKRFLLFPPGSAVKFTCSVSKQLLSQYPSGLNFVLEAAAYYPVPEKRTDLLPKRLKPPTTPKPKPKPTTEPLLVWIPGTDWRFKAKPVAKPHKVHRIDTTNGGPLQWTDRRPSWPNKYEKYTNPDKWLKWSKYGATDYASKYAWTPPKMPTQYQSWPTATSAKWTKWSQPNPSQSSWSRGHANKWPRKDERRPWRDWTQNASNSYDEWPRRGRRTKRAPYYKIDKIEDDAADHEAMHKYEPMHFPDLELYTDWQHYNSHRDRRQLFHHFEGLSKFIGIDLKVCILRAICDSKRLLLPPGYSMIQDIMRVVFHFPTISGLKDEYSRIMRADYEECNRQLSAEHCPFSLLEWMSTKPSHLAKAHSQRK